MSSQAFPPILASSLRSRLEASLSWQSVLGLFGLAFGGILFFLIQPQLDNDIATVQARLALSERTSSKPDLDLASSMSKEALNLLTESWNTLTPVADGSKVIVEISRLASLARIKLRTVNTTNIAATNSLPAHINLSFQVRGSYGGIRAWMAMVLNSVPSANVVQAQFTRVDAAEQSGSTAVFKDSPIDASIVMALWVRS